MGTCQSSLCPLADDSVVEKGRQNPMKFHRPTALQSTNKKLVVKLAENVLSPAMTEATTPASNGSLTPSYMGSFNLASVISSGSTFTFESGSESNEMMKQPSKFTFDNVPIIMEEEEADAPSDEEEEYISQQQQKIQPSPVDMIMNPPLLAPSPKEVDTLLSCSSRSQSKAGNGRMLREFQRMKLRAQRVAHQAKSNKNKVKIEERTEEVKGYQDLWEDFQNLESLHTAAMKAKQEEEGELLIPTETKDDSFLDDPKDSTNRRLRLKKNNSFDLQNTDTWFVNFRRAKHSNYNKDFDDDISCQSGLSLLSKESMDAQRVLYAEKRRQREARFEARRKKWENKEPSQEHSSKGSKDYESYFQELLKETELPRLSTPMVSPPRLAVLTGQSKVTLGVNDYGPIRPTLSRETSITDMEVAVPSEEKKPPADDTSGITDVDFDHDFRSHRRRRGARSIAKHDDNMSMGSSLISYGDFSSNVRTCNGKENIPPMQQFEKKLASSGVTDTIAASESQVPFGQGRTVYSLGDRIAQLEKKMGINPPEQVSNKGDLTTLESGNTTAREILRVVGLAPKENGASYIKSPLHDSCNQQPHSPELEPTQLQKMFDDQSASPPSAPTTSYSDVREQIVMGNCNYLRESIKFMTTEEFRRISTDHALVRWEKDSVTYQPNGYNEEEHDQQIHTKINGELSSPDHRDESYADDIADEVETLLAKYRNHPGDYSFCEREVIDAHEMLKNDDSSNLGDSFATAQGKLYSA